jgi:hypothetical protein
MAAQELGFYAHLAALEKQSCTAHPNAFYAANVMA